VFGVFTLTFNTLSCQNLFSEVVGVYITLMEILEGRGEELTEIPPMVGV